MYQLDLDILYFFNRTIASGPLDTVMAAVTNIRYWIPVYVLAAGFLIWRHKWHGVRVVVGVALVAGVADYLTNTFVKEWIARPRPSAAGLPVAEWLRVPNGIRHGYSLPSSHAVNNFAAATFLAILFPRKNVIAILFGIAFLIAITRPYLGLHYPSDILAGAAAGVLVGFSFAKGFLLVEEKFFPKPKSVR